MTPRSPAVLCALAFAALGSTLTGCADVSDARTEGLSRRIDRQDARIEDRQTRRQMRAEAEDRRYHAWYDRIMGRPQARY
jgi:hypothetical protein